MELKKLLKEIDIKKAVGVDTFPPKLIKIGAEDIFPDNAKIVASVVPPDKGKPDKYDVLNYRPVSILNAFSKIYEKALKSKLVSYFDNISLCLYQRIGKVTALSRFLFVC